MKGVSQPTVERGSPGSSHQGKLLCQDRDRVRGGGQARWSYYSSSTLAPSRLSSDEILYIILPSSNPSPLHPAPPCAHPCWPLGPSPRNHLPFLLPCGSCCFFPPRWHLAGHSHHPPSTLPTSLCSAKVLFPFLFPSPTQPTSDRPSEREEEEDAFL